MGKKELLPFKSNTFIALLTVFKII
jgi:hypothetical protein